MGRPTHVGYLFCRSLLLKFIFFPLLYGSWILFYLNLTRRISESSLSSRTGRDTSWANTLLWIRTGNQQTKAEQTVPSSHKGYSCIWKVIWAVLADNSLVICTEYTTVQPPSWEWQYFCSLHWKKNMEVCITDWYGVFKSLFKYLQFSLLLLLKRKSITAKNQ